MIDPTDVTNFNRTLAELQEYWLFSVVVAGKTATVQAKALERFLTTDIPEDLKDATPFEKVEWMDKTGVLLQRIKDSRLGQFTRLERVFRDSLKFDMKTVTTDQLETIPGVGAKTSRFYVLHTRANQRIAVLDTHVLRHMRDPGLTTQKGTPPKGAKYEALEKEFLKLADKSGKSIADFDLWIWNKYSRKVA